MSKNYFKHFIEIGSGTIISMFIGFLTTPIITRIVEPTDYGIYSMFTVYTNLALMVLCLGFDQVLVRYFYEYKSDNYKKYLLHKCVKIPIFFSVFAIIAIIIFEILIVIEYKW